MNKGDLDNIQEIATQGENNLDNYLVKIVTGKTLDDLGINLGDISCVKINDKRVALHFNNSVQLEQVDTIQYSIYTSNLYIYPTVTMNFTPQVHNMGTSNEYYSFELPTDLTEKWYTLYPGSIL